MMRARKGDWLIVKSGVEGRARRQAEILEVGTAGGPPYRVQWVDDGRTGLIFPGPDAIVLGAAQKRAEDRRANERAAAVQREINRRHVTTTTAH
jgi:hypothetical protein